MRVLQEAIDVATEVTKVLAERGGRAADSGISLPFLGSMAALAGDGDHVDIGALYGASALTVALTKKKLGLKGDVYCIDPYNAEERDAIVSGGAGLSSPVSATAEELLKNAEHFGIELKLIQKYSHPWPEELKDNTFATAYIDGAHGGDGPMNDFLNLRGRVTDYIGTDNMEEEYPDVVRMVLFAAVQDDWHLYYKNLIFVALRRIMPSRSLAAGNYNPGEL